MNPPNSLTEQYNAYREHFLDHERNLRPLSNLRMMIKSRVAQLMTDCPPEDVRAFVAYAKSNGYFRTEVDAIESAANDRDDVL